MRGAERRPTDQAGGGRPAPVNRVVLITPRGFLQGAAARGSEDQRLAIFGLAGPSPDQRGASPVAMRRSGSGTFFRMKSFQRVLFVIPMSSRASRRVPSTSKPDLIRR